MSPDLEAKLIKMYPELYRGSTKSVHETSMCFGFQCGDGWYGIIDRLSHAIVAECRAREIPIPEATTVKEKYGSLSFYMSNEYDFTDELTDRAEAESERICEMCGDPAQLRQKGNWLQTLCLSCADKHGFELKKPLSKPFP